MVDVQSMKDERRIPIQKVGVKGARYPIVLRDKAAQIQHTIAVVNLYADLPHEFKGTHMSRFIEVFEEYRQDISVQRIIAMLQFPRGRVRVIGDPVRRAAYSFHQRGGTCKIGPVKRCTTWVSCSAVKATGRSSSTSPSASPVVVVTPRSATAS